MIPVMQIVIDHGATVDSSLKRKIHTRGSDSGCFLARFRAQDGSTSDL